MPSESIQQSTLSNAAFGRAPANIALIKYMGKSDPSLNQPANSSLSLTLHSLCTVVEALWVIPQDPSFIKWIPELPRVSLEKAQLPSPWSLEVPSLTTQNINRTLQHSKKAVAFARAHLPQHGFEVHEKSFFEKNQLEIRSANTFPPSTGIASSASSFAALTLAVCLSCVTEKKRPEFLKFWKGNKIIKRIFSNISRQGSGSSSRCFEGPFVLWESEEAALTESVLPPLTDLVLVLTEAAKKVSSSEAHARVKTSPLWQGRKERAEARCQTVLRALKCGDFKTLSEHSWSELWEMHSLFHTSIEPFSYFTGESVEALRFATLFLKDKNPPIVTLDAGANLHWIVPDTEADVWTRRLLEQFPGKRILTDHQGTGGFPFEA